MKIKPEQMGDFIDDGTGANDGSMSRWRPYDGQPWTSKGMRGTQLVEGLSMRDIRDCFVRAVAGSTGPGWLYRESERGEKACISEIDLHQIDLSKIDIVAVGQNLTCEIEKLMGIFPNVPEMTLKETMEYVPVADLENPESDDSD